MTWDCVMPALVAADSPQGDEDMAKRNRRAVGYVRRSSVTDENGDSLAAQKQKIREWAKANDVRLVKIYQDEGVSGTVEAVDRPGLSDALEALNQGDAEILVVTTLDRLSRKLTVQEAALSHAWLREASVYAMDAGEIPKDDPDDPMRTAMRQMMGVFAQLDRGMVVAKLRRGKLRKQARGGFIGGTVPYGTRHEGKDLVDDDAELGLVARVKDLRRQGESYRAICETLTEEGYETRRGAPWQPMVVRDIANRAEN